MTSTHERTLTERHTEYKNTNTVWKCTRLHPPSSHPPPSSITTSVLPGELINSNIIQRLPRVLLLLLSLDAHNHVDDYSGTLRAVRKKKKKKMSTLFSVLVTSPLNCLKFILKTATKQTNKQTKNKQTTKNKQKRINKSSESSRYLVTANALIAATHDRRSF